MRDPINMYILIGGKMKSDKIPLLAEAIYNDCSENILEIDHDECPHKLIESQLTKRKSNSPLRIQCPTYLGDCGEIKSMCKSCKLSYLHFCEAKDDYDAALTYWMPGMKKEKFSLATQSGNPLMAVSDAEEYINFMYDALSLGLGGSVERHIKLKIAKACLRSKKSIMETVGGYLQKTMWHKPEIPNFEVI